MLEAYPSAPRHSSVADYPMLAVDETGSIVSCNPVAEQLLGLTAAEIAARFSLESSSHATDGDGADPYTASVGSAFGVMTLVDAEGHHLAIKGTSLKLDPGLVDRPLTLLVLDQRYATPSAIADLASDSLAHISQEVRAPLCVIGGYVDLLLDRHRTIRRAGLGKIAHLLRNHVRWLDQMVAMLLAALDVLSGRLEIDPQPTRLDTLFEEAAAMVELLSAGRQRRLTIVLPQTGATIRADRRHVVQILSGLLCSAVKYAPVGANLSLSSIQMDDHWRVNIVQTGEGVPWWSHGYGDVRHSPTSTIANRGGYDLGLALAKAVVELHGGTLGASSAGKNNSTLWFTLPSQVLANTQELGAMPAPVPAPVDSISVQ